MLGFHRKIISYLLSGGKNRYPKGHRMKRSYLFLLILCNLIWALNPMMGKSLLQSFTGVQVAWVRYSSAFLSFLIFALLGVLAGRRKWTDYFLIPRQLRTWLELLALGLGPFVFSPLMQFVGLETTQAMDNSILIATEPLVTVLLAWVVLGEKMNRYHTRSIVLALVGLVFFSGVFTDHPGVLFTTGMIFLILAQFGEAAYSIFGRKLVLRYPPLPILGTGLAIGALTLSGWVLVFDRFPDLGHFSPANIRATLYLGPIGSTLTYLVWVTIARSVSVPAMAITLFIQPIVGFLVGYLFLAESLTVARGFGAFLILAAIAYLSFQNEKKGLP